MGTGTQAEYHIKAMLALELCTEIRWAIQYRLLGFIVWVSWYNFNDTFTTTRGLP